MGDRLVPVRRVVDEELPDPGELDDDLAREEGGDEVRVRGERIVVLRGGDGGEDASLQGEAERGAGGGRTMSATSFMFGVVIMPKVCAPKLTRNEATVSTRERERSLLMMFHILRTVNSSVE